MSNFELTTENFQIFIEHDFKAKAWSFFKALIDFFVRSRNWDIWVFRYKHFSVYHPVMYPKNLLFNKILQNENSIRDYDPGRAVYYIVVVALKRTGNA